MIPGSGRFPWRRKWQPTPVLLPRKFHGWRSLVGYSPWGLKELDTTERLHSQVKNKKTKKYTQALILSATPLLNHYKIPYQILPGKDKPFLWDMSLSCPPLPGKVIKLSSLVSPKTLSPGFDLALVRREAKLLIILVLCYFYKKSGHWKRDC